MKNLEQILLTAPPQLRMTAANLERVNLSPDIEGNIDDRISVKKLEVVLKRVTNEVSAGSRANWNM